MSVFVLDDWSFRAGHWAGFCGPDSVALSAYGLVSSNPKFRDRTAITTSQLLYLDPDKMIIKTINSTYQLLNMHPNFQEYLSKNGLTLEQYQAALI